MIAPELESCFRFVRPEEAEKTLIKRPKIVDSGDTHKSSIAGDSFVFQRADDESQTVISSPSPRRNVIKKFYHDESRRKNISVIDRAPKDFSWKTFSLPRRRRLEWRRPTSDEFFVREIPQALATMTQLLAENNRRGCRWDGRRENRKNYVVA
jgi:hypothetical protein